MKKYILIIVITHALSQGGVTAFSAEFDSNESCSSALQEIAKDIKRTTYNSIVSYGCYEK